MGSLRSVATMAAVSFLIQGTLWAVLTILGILTYSCYYEPKEEMSQNPSFTAMAKYYFSDSQCWTNLPDRKAAGITSSKDIILLVSFEFTFNFLLAVVSLVLLFVIPRGSTISFLGWLYSFLFLGFAVCITDIVAMTTFSADKNVLEGTPSSNLAPLTNMLLLVSLVAARGIVYWALNISILFYIFVSATMRLFKACRKLDEEKDRMNGNVNAAYEEDERGLPAHTAVSRWPGVGRLWRSQRAGARREQWSQESVLRDRAGLGARQELMQRPGFRDAFSYTVPLPSRGGDGDPPALRPQAKGEAAATRPNSLQEAILTIKPLRQVRPKIPDMQNSYGEISFGDEDESVGFIDFDSSFSSESGSDSSESSSSEEKEDKIERRTHKRHRRPIHLDICKCQDERCTCCFKFLKNQICDNFQLVNVSSDSKSLGVEFNVTVNDKSVYSDELSFERLPTVCYRKANIGICGKLTAKEIKSDDEKRVEFCGDLQLKFNSEVIAHFNVFCVKVGKKSEQTEDENVLNDDGTFTFWPKI